jgi:hypothetical protein
MPTYKEEKLGLDVLLFDPNNYRFQETKDFVYADPARFHEKSVQDRAYRTLKETPTLPQLKASILRNGFLPVERLVVTPYDPQPGSFLVIEGNRRLAALRWIADDNDAGVNIRDDVKADLLAVPVIIVEGDATGLFQRALMGIRHVSGIDQWGGYQRAKLVVELRDDFRLESGEVAERVGMTAQEVNRRYRAFKALQQMQSDEEFGVHAKAEMYPLFHEAVSLPAVKEWLGWNEAESRFTNGTGVEQFYSLISPGRDDGAKSPAKLTTYGEIRELRNILSNNEARAVLVDPARTFLDALTIAKRAELSKNWLSSIAGAIDALTRLSILELQASTAEERGEIEKLRALAAKTLENYEKLK